jgi:hypothetical protein
MSPCLLCWSEERSSPWFQKPLCYVLVIAVEVVHDNRFVQQPGSVIYLPNLQIAHCLRQISCRNLIEFWIAWQVWVDFSRTPSLSDKICMMMTRLACNRAIESSYWRMDNNSDVGLLTGYVLYRLPIELESMDLDTFSRWFGMHPSLRTSW